MMQRFLYCGLEAIIVMSVLGGRLCDLLFSCLTGPRTTLDVVFSGRLRCNFGVDNAAGCSKSDVSDPAKSGGMYASPSELVPVAGVMDLARETGVPELVDAIGAAMLERRSAIFRNVVVADNNRTRAVVALLRRDLEPEALSTLGFSVVAGPWLVIAENKLSNSLLESLMLLSFSL